MDTRKKTSKTALMVMDVQAGFVSGLVPPSVFLPLLAKTINTARPLVDFVIYTTVAFRPGYPEIAPNNPTFNVAIKTGTFLEGSPETKIVPAVAPKQGDIQLEKKRVSAFSGSGLDVILRGSGIDTLVLAGITTSGVVLSTLAEAFDSDFNLVVLKDLCADSNVALHNALIAGLFPSRA
ncbi:isochorismatase family protein [Lasiosphaeria ovina]|uniref:Isochorismatase family protein n=1 Tax=Lasiosphaeria ovina TaxID=92902 RepID=A0AAE0JTR1_9PEZI|nr:isochorismatase family protein [Lasiosphaeria ovina]